MFCGECGAKNEKNSQFCSECGKPLEGEQTTSNNPVSNKPKERKPMSKKNKIIITVGLAFVVILGIGYKVGSDLTNPKKIAEDYIKALVKMDGNKLYDYIEIDGDTTFASKEMFTNMLKEDSDEAEIINYKITDIEYGDSKLSAEVTYKYTTSSSTSERTDTVNLTKQKNKKFLIFDNWKIADLSSDSLLIEDYVVKVPKDAKVVYGGVEVASKYLNQEKSTTKLDAYVLPKVFIYDTTVKATLTNGIELEDETRPTSYRNSCTLEFDEDSITDSTKEKLISKTKESLTTTYNNAIAQKEFSEIKATFEYGNIDLSDFEQSYQTLVTKLKSTSRTLTSIEFTDMSIYDVSLTTEGYIEVEVRASFDYTTKSTSYNGEETTDEDDDYKYITATYSYDNGEYHLVDLTKLQYYFY